MTRLIEVLKWLTKILPRFITMLPDEGGVLIRFGRYIKTLEEGGHCILIWPVIHTVESVTTTRQIVDVPTQDVLTKDRIPVCMNVSVEYVISDPYKAIYGVEDFDECLQELTGDTSRQVLNGYSFDTCVDFMHVVQLEIFEKIEKKAEQYGVDVLEVRVPTFTKGHTIRLIQQ
ncbi:MAG: hypothetical protein FVQ80_11135 [Planctomycetes bacterium]|nr:hypothetical protein [Planctomycetota bacterium]